MALFLTEGDVGSLLTMNAALEAVEEAFRLRADGRGTSHRRSRLILPGGDFNTMSAAAPGLGVMGVKAYASPQGSPAQTYVQISSTETDEQLALIEASGMERMCAGAACGVATRHMARRDASTVGIVGADRDAAAHLEAVCRVRPIRSAKLFSSASACHGETLAAELATRLGVSISAADT